MLLLTNSSFHMAKYLDPRFLTYGPNEMRSVQKTKVRIFAVCNEPQATNNKLMRTLLYNNHEVVVGRELSENLRTTDEISLEP